MNFDRMRALLLDQAIRGELVPQLAEEGVVEIGAIAPEAFKLPKTWKWLTLKSLVIPTKQIIPEESFTYLDVSSIKNFQIDEIKRLDPSNAPSRARKVVQPGMVLFATVRPYLKNICVSPELPGQVIASTAFATMTCSKDLNNRYLFYFLRSDFFTDLVKSKQRGISYPAISEKDFYAFPVPVPPLDEQIRIVAKLDDAFAEIDRAEKAYEELQTLAGVLRGQILQEAIQGKLVPQLVSDGVTKQIAEAPEEVPFDIPNTWSWIRGEELAVKRKTIDPSTLTNDEIELWSIPAYDAGVAEKVSPGDIRSSKKVVQAGDVLLAKIVPHIERVWIVSESANSLMKLASTEWLVYASELFLPEFMGLLFRSPYFRTKMMESVSGMGSLKRANPRTLAKVWLPVPPIKEQERIVIKVETLLKQVNLLLTK